MSHWEGWHILYKTLGRRIRQQRIKKKYTQAQLAEFADISLSFYGHIERGTRKMSLDTFCKIAEALECSADELLGTRSDRRQKACAKELLAMAEQMAENINRTLEDTQR